MVEEIRGEVVSLDDEFVVIDVGGLGIGVSTTKAVVSKTTIGQRMHLFTDLVLRETAVNLYGFTEKSTRNTFRTLIKVNGVGPKAALAILSNMSVVAVRNAVNMKDAAQCRRHQLP